MAASLAAAFGTRTASGQRLPATREVPWLREIQTPPARLPADAPRLLPLLIDPGKNPIRTRPHWEKQREYLLAQWLELVQDKEQKIARPKQIYTGDRTLDFVPASERWA